MGDTTLEKKMASIIKDSIHGVVKQTVAEARAAAAEVRAAAAAEVRAAAAAEARAAAVAKDDAASYAKINKLFYLVPPIDTFFYYKSNLNCNLSPPVGTWTWSVPEGQHYDFLVLVFNHFDMNGNVSTELLNLRPRSVIKLQAGQGPDAAGNDLSHSRHTCSRCAGDHPTNCCIRDKHSNGNELPRLSKDDYVRNKANLEQFINPDVENYQIWRVISLISSHPDTVAYYVQYISPLGRRYIFPDNKESLVIVHQPGIQLDENQDEITHDIILPVSRKKKEFSIFSDVDSRFPDVPDPDLLDSQVQQILERCSLTCSPRYIFETVLQKKIPLYRFKDKYPIDYLSKYFTSGELKQLYDEYAGKGAYQRRVSIENLVASAPPPQQLVATAPVTSYQLELEQRQLTAKLTQRQLTARVSLEFMIDLIRSAENNERRRSSPLPPPPTEPSLDDVERHELWKKENTDYRIKYGDLWDHEVEPYMQQQHCQCAVSGGGRQRKKNIRHNKNIKKKNKSVKKFIKMKKKKSSRKS